MCVKDGERESESVCVNEREMEKERESERERESGMVFPQFEKFTYFVRVCADRALLENGNSCFFRQSSLIVTLCS